MDPVFAIIIFAVGLIAGFVVARILLAKQQGLVVQNARSELETELATTKQSLEHATNNLNDAQAELVQLQSIRDELNKLQATYDEHKKSTEEKLNFLDETKKHLEDQFKLISNDVATKSRKEIQ